MKPSSSLRRVREMVRKEFLQLFRDPRMYGILLAAPVMQLVVFGFAVSTDVRDTATFLVDQDRTAASRELVEAWTASGYFRIVGRSQDPGELVRALDHGDAIVGLTIPVGFAADLDRSEGTVQVLLDGSNSNLATVAQGYAEQILTTWGLTAAEIRVEPPVELRHRAFFNPDLASRDYNVPAVIGAIITLICLLLTSLSIVREREIGTLEQLMVSPIRPIELLVGKTIPFGLIGILDMALVTALAVLFFKIPLVGSVGLLLLATVLYLLSALGAGLLISTISKTQQEAFMSTFLVLMPTLLLSGFMFPVRRMPKFFQWVAYLNPLTHYLEIIRGIFLKGVGMEALWFQHAALLVLGALLMATAVARFQKHVA